MQALLFEPSERIEVIIVKMKCAEMERKNVIVEKSLVFALEVVRFCEILESKKKFDVANQLIRCGTAIGANIFESQHAESRADFIHKMKLAIKEANEALYWLMVCEKK